MSERKLVIREDGEPVRESSNGRRYELPPQKRLFALEYIVDFNATQAAIRAGYGRGGASVKASQLLRDERVVALIDRHLDERQRRAEATGDRVVAELSRLAFLDPLQLLTPDGAVKPLDQMGEDARRAIVSLEVVELFEGIGDERKLVGYVKKVKLHDKIKPLDLLGRYHKLWESEKSATIMNMVNQARHTQINMLNKVDLSEFSTEELEVLLSAGLKLQGDEVTDLSSPLDVSGGG